jgi:hypothetical protein
MSAAREFSGQRADGTEFPIKISLSVETSDGTVVVETIIDVSVREVAPFLMNRGTVSPATVPGAPMSQVIDAL